MIVQRFRRVVPERDASIQRTVLVGPGFGITVLRVHGLAQDWGAQGEVVSFLTHLHRAQLSILLAGRGYFAMPGGPLLLRPGDAVESDQRLGQAEGYFGTPGLVLMVEWDRDTLFGPGTHGAARHSRLSEPELARLRALATRIDRTLPSVWLVELCAELRAAGLAVEREVGPLVVSAPRAASLYGAMGDALERLHDFPSLGEIASSLQVGERQVRRDFEQLTRELGQPYEGWRDFLSDARLGWVTQLLSIPGLTQARVAELAGFRSPVALAHAFSLRGACTPGELASTLRGRWC